MLTFDEIDHYAFTGYWTNIYSGIVFADKDGGSGSLYRDMYDDDKDYCKPEFDTSTPFFAHFQGRPPYQSIT